MNRTTYSDGCSFFLLFLLLYFTRAVVCGVVSVEIHEDDKAIHNMMTIMSRFKRSRDRSVCGGGGP